MANQNVPGAASSASATIPPQMGELFTQARADAVGRAGREILALAQAAMSARAHGGRVDDPETLTDAVLRRIELLGSCVAVLTDPRTDAEEIGAQYQLVFGRLLEVNHA